MTSGTQRAVVAVSLLVFFLCVGVAYAKPQSVTHGGKTYYVVTSTDSAVDTGTEVCASMGKQCLGYTGKSNDICKRLHKDAGTKSDSNGSSAGFYCNGAPQGGVCANEINTCHICPNCNVGVTCDERIGGLYREMFVECTPDEPTKLTGVWKNFMEIPGRWWGMLRSTVQRSFDEYRKKLAVLTQQLVIKHAKIQVQGPNGTVEADIPVDSLVCEFYQQNKKLATCGAVGAADAFCVQAFGSRFATAALCQDNGVIVCSKPCTTNPQEVKPTRCAFDGDRPRGNQAAPLDFCSETKTIKVDMGGLGKKKAGQECAHGGECGTGICLGQPSDSGIKYFCSCKQNVHDYTCGK